MKIVKKPHLHLWRIVSTLLTPYNVQHPFKNKNGIIISIFGLLTLEMAILGQNLGRCPRALVMDLGWIFLAGVADVC